MKISVFAIGHKMPAWVSDTFKNYNQRLPPSHKIQLLELPPTKRGKNTPAELVKSADAEMLFKHIKPNDHLIALDEAGKALSTQMLSNHMQRWQFNGNNVVIVIGGAEGLHSSVIEKAQSVWSLSRLTFPHQLVRVILVEQIYRAYSLLNNHPYHRD